MNDASAQDGAYRRREWRLDPAIAYLNHGGFGVTPQAVLDVQDQWRRRIERNPSRFLTFEIDDCLRRAVRPVAAALGAREDDLVFVENATSGLNAILRSFDFEPGDEILMTNLAYPAIRKAALYVASRTGARFVEVPVKLPIASEDDILRAVARHLSIKTKLAVFDHIASHCALVLPVKRLTDLAHEAGARVAIDGAHVPGLMPLDIAGIGADWYVGNLHKWYFAPRSCGFLWSAADVQRGTHPLCISHGYGSGYRVEFEWTGTRDVTPTLATQAALDFHDKLGGASLMARNRTLAHQAATMLAGAWGTELTGPLDMIAAMATVRLPLVGEAGGERANHLMRELGEAHRIETAVFSLEGALWVRVCAQAYNDMAEYERLAAIYAGPA